MMLGAFGYDHLTIANAIGQIVSQTLRRNATRDVVAVGVGVELLIAEFRREHPAKVPTHPAIPGRGLLARPEIPFGDFELAHHLYSIHHREMARLQKQFPGIPVLIAYLAVISVSPEKSHSLGAAQLMYAIGESGFKQRVTEQMVEAAQVKLAKLSKDGSRGGKASGDVRRAKSKVPTPEVLRAEQERLINVEHKDQRFTAGILANNYGIKVRHMRTLLKRH